MNLGYHWNFQSNLYMLVDRFGECLSEAACLFDGVPFCVVPFVPLDFCKSRMSKK